MLSICSDMSGASGGGEINSEGPIIEEIPASESEEEIFYDASEETKDYKAEWKIIMVSSIMTHHYNL